MFESRSFYSHDGQDAHEHLEEWLNALVRRFEIIGYQAFWKGSALGTGISITIKYVNV